MDFKEITVHFSPPSKKKQGLVWDSCRDGMRKTVAARGFELSPKSWFCVQLLGDSSLREREGPTIWWEGFTGPDRLRPTEK